MALQFEAALAQLSAQHKQFLAQVATAGLDALKAENSRLMREVGELKQALKRGPPARGPGGGLRISAAGGGAVVGAVVCSDAAGGRHISAIRPWTAATVEDAPTPPQAVPHKLDIALKAAEGGGRLGAAIEVRGDEWLAPMRSVDGGFLRQNISFGKTKAGRPEAWAGMEVAGSIVSVASSLPAAPVLPPALLILNDVRRTKERRRLRHLLEIANQGNFSSRSARVSGETLFTILKARDTELQLTEEGTQAVVHAFACIAQGLLQEDQAMVAMDACGNHVSVNALVEIMWLPCLEDYIDDEFLGTANIIVQALRVPTTAEIVHEVSRSTGPERPEVEEGGQKSKRGFRWFLQAAVSTVVVVNMLCMGISIDRAPEHIAWLILEVICTGVFLFEMCYWLTSLGVRNYFCGSSALWNISDMTITLMAVFQLFFEIVNRLNIDLGGEISAIASATSSSVMLRALRAIRVVRLVKLVKSPVLKDLANMLVGFVIGLPSLMWVLVMFVLILCLFGLFFRLMFGPSPEQMKHPLFATCGRGDEITSFDDPNCPLENVYGEEFFGSVGKSMFTCFRFMLGDYSTRGGVSLVVTFSQEYGTKFDVTFVAWMIVVIFGIFNIITAIFVDTTVAGLKHNDVKRKHAQQYERVYVQGKLSALLHRIRVLEDDRCLDLGLEMNGGHIELTEEQFAEVVNDYVVKALLQDLDVEVFNLPAMYCTFDGDNSGQVTLQELAEGIMKLRGEPQKTDIIGCWISTRQLHEKVDDLKGILEMRTTGAAVKSDRPSMSMTS